MPEAETPVLQERDRCDQVCAGDGNLPSALPESPEVCLFLQFRQQLYCGWIDVGGASILSSSKIELMW